MENYCCPSLEVAPTKSWTWLFGWLSSQHALSPVLLCFSAALHRMPGSSKTTGSSESQKIATRQVPAFSERNQLSQAIPQFHVERILHERMPIARSKSQHNECKDCEDHFLFFERRCVASDSNRRDNSR